MTDILANILHDGLNGMLPKVGEFIVREHGEEMSQLVIWKTLSWQAGGKGRIWRGWRRKKGKDQ